MPQDPTWLVSAKLRSNPPMGRLLFRAGIDGLIDRVEPGLVLLHAPAGYGKTSAMAQWHQRAEANGRCAAWLSLDEQDADPIQFLCYLIAACHKAGCSIDYPLPPHPQALAGSSLEFLTTTVLNAIASSAPPDIIFLDDFQRAENDANSTIIRRMISALTSSTIVLSSRSHPGNIGTADLRAHGRLLEVSQKELQFSADEVRAYLGSIVNLENEDEYCADLAARTEGWPIALQAIRQLIKSGESAEQALSQASGRSSVLSDYFLEQVFDSLSGEQQRLLLNTAILERVNGDLADAICNTSAAWLLLDELEKNDVFIQSLDPERQWYRYHRLFAEFISERARREVEIDSAKNAGKAAEWFRDNGHPTEALQYALLSGDPRLIAETLESIGGWRQAVMGNLTGVQQAMRNIPIEVVHEFPKVWMADIYTKLKTGDLEDAAAELNALTNTYAEQLKQNSVLRNDLGLIDTLLVGYRDEHQRLDEQIDFLENAGVSASRDDDYFQAMRFNSLCFFYFRRGAFTKALAAGETSIHYYQKGGSLYGETFIYFLECFGYYLQGRLRDANATLAQGLKLSASHFGTESDLYAIGAAFAALFAYEQNDLSKAQKFLDVALPLIERSDAWTEVYLAAYTAALSLAEAGKDWDKFTEIHRNATATAVSRELSRVAQFADTCRSNFVLRAETQEDFSQNHQQPQPPTSSILTFDGFHEISTYARFLIREERFDDAVSILSEHVETARAHQLNRALITLSLLCAIAHRGRGDIDAASDCFSTVLSCSIFEDFRRPIIDEGPVVADLIADIEQHASLQRHNRLRDNFLAALLTEIKAEHKDEPVERELLSPREQKVLRSLIHGRTNREISEDIGISQNTVKFHLKNVFQKLGVSSRQDAVRVSLRDRVI